MSEDQDPNQESSAQATQAAADAEAQRPTEAPDDAQPTEQQQPPAAEESTEAREAAAEQPAPAEAADDEASEAEAEAVEFDPERLSLHVEAVVMTADRAVAPGKLSDAFGGVGVRAIREAVKRLNDLYEEAGRSFRIEEVAGGYQVLTLPEFADVLARMNKTRQSNRLSGSALETLAIIAYKQPITRAEIEAIRGVASGEVVRSLMERHLVKVTGRAEELGRPMLYGTTRSFLEVFGLANLRDLPKVEELNKLISDKS